MIHLANLTLGYDRHPAVHHLTLEIPTGALVAVVGPNGAGKSTLLKGMTGELRPIEGHVVMGPGPVAYLPQQNDIDPDFPITVFDMVAMGLWREIGAFRGCGPRERARVFEALASVGMRDYADRPIGALSGGQFQRARFARLLLQDAPVVLLDEPFTAIDSRTTTDLMRIVLDWHCIGRTVIAVLHDLEEVHRHFPTALLVARETIAYGPTDTVLTAENLRRARRRAESFDAHASVCHRPPEEETA